MVSRIVGPDNKRLWRSMVLKHFDFTLAASSFNVENDSPEDFFDDFPNNQGEVDEGIRLLIEDVKAWSNENNSADFPDMYFDEDYSLWETLGVYFRASQYSFLEQIQHNPALVVSLWPKYEDPFNLFRDLMILQKFVWPENKVYKMNTQFGDPARPVLLRALDNDSVDKNTMMKNCGYPPHYRNTGDGLSQRWTGFDEPRPSLEVPEFPKRYSGWKPTSYELATKEERMLLPRSSAIDFLKLRRIVYDSFDDWRNLHVAECSIMGAEFHFGRSKVSGRWLGFVDPSFYG